MSKQLSLAYNNSSISNNLVSSLHIKTVCFQAILFRRRTKYSYIWPIDNTLSGVSIKGPELTWEWWQWRSTPHSPKVHHYINDVFRCITYIMYFYLFMCISVYIYIGSISSLILISFNIIDIFCLHIFLWIRSYFRIAFIVFDRNWFMYCP